MMFHKALSGLLWDGLMFSFAVWRDMHIPCTGYKGGNVKKRKQGWLLLRRVTTSKIMPPDIGGEWHRPFSDILSV